MSLVFLPAQAGGVLQFDEGSPEADLAELLELVVVVPLADAEGHRGYEATVEVVP
eukprot:CAMPEP_0170479102 /NCGR_PEP_ID=MMETSP0208-20121228/454_1 /TAXON_ID=197538 /ORGANISM="Strombidium inclinatum, Strain S3" /LENGTH=54 /DNA_ID=CAMNT_0010751445 /DNA_START=24 /DNA_END=188 /DNA_ORIENTATION=-